MNIPKVLTNFVNSFNSPSKVTTLRSSFYQRDNFKTEYFSVRSHMTNPSNKNKAPLLIREAEEEEAAIAFPREGNADDQFRRALALIEYGEIGEASISLRKAERLDRHKYKDILQKYKPILDEKFRLKLTEAAKRKELSAKKETDSPEYIGKQAVSKKDEPDLNQCDYKGELTIFKDLNHTRQHL